MQHPIKTANLKTKKLKTLIMGKTFSLWKLYHESVYTVMAYKVKDTNSSKVVDKWLASSCDNAASFYREEQEINAEYLQTFQEQ